MRGYFYLIDNVPSVKERKVAEQESDNPPIFPGDSDWTVLPLTKISPPEYNSQPKIADPYSGYYIGRSEGLTLWDKTVRLARRDLPAAWHFLFPPASALLVGEPTPAGVPVDYMIGLTSNPHQVILDEDTLLDILESYDKVGEEGHSVYVRSAEIRTQKAAGVMSIAWYLASYSHSHTLIQRDGDLSIPGRLSLLDAQFARPCPVRPRHGFVESRVVHGPEELRAVWVEARAADPDAELLLAAPLSAKTSGVITPTLSTFGRGNDGATAGHKTVSLPLTLSIPSDPILSAARIGSEDTPYVEIVSTGPTPAGGKTFAVQLRAGPKLGTPIADFIPETVKVQRIIKAGGDLLEWEQKMAEHREPGLVIHHPGGSMLSHYAVHARLNNIPVITSKLPVRKGTVLQQTAEAGVFDPEAVRAGVFRGLQYLCANGVIHHSANTDVLTYSFAVLHNSPNMVGDYGVHLGAAITFLMAFGAAAAVGEARHEDVEFLKAASVPYPSDRSNVYTAVISDYRKRRHLLEEAARLFGQIPEHGSYGGYAWYECAVATIKLDQDVGRLLLYPTAAAVREAAEQANIVLNMAHNGGWWFNKFVSPDVLDSTARGELCSVMRLSDTAVGIGTARGVDWEPAALSIPPLAYDPNAEVWPCEDACEDCELESQEYCDECSRCHPYECEQVCYLCYGESDSYCEECGRCNPPNEEDEEDEDYNESSPSGGLGDPITGTSPILVPGTVTSVLIKALPDGFHIQIASNISVTPSGWSTGFKGSYLPMNVYPSPDMAAQLSGILSDWPAKAHSMAGSGTEYCRASIHPADDPTKPIIVRMGPVIIAIIQENVSV